MEDYTRLFDYSAYQNANPTKPLPGVRVNIDLNDIDRAISETNTVLRSIADSNGGLLPGTVGFEQLTADAIAEITVDGAETVLAAASASAAAALASQTAASGSATAASGSATSASGSATASAASAVAAAASAAALSSVEDLLAVSANGRLTLTTGVAVTSADVTGATTVYFTPSGPGRNTIPVRNGSALIVPLTFSELPLTLDSNSGHTGYHLSGGVFDVFGYDSGSGVAKLGTGPAWSTSTTRGSGAGTTEIEFVNGFWVNKNTITLRFGINNGDTVSVPARQATLLGSLVMTANGQTEDSKAARYVSNVYNAVPRTLVKTISASTTWGYSTAAWAPANGSGFSRFQYLHCLPGRLLKARTQDIVQNDVATFNSCWTGVGIDSQTVPSAIGSISTSQSALIQSSAFYQDYPGLGRHDIYWLQFGAGVNNQTWYFNSGNWQGGLFGETDN